MALLRYFKPVDGLPNPKGPLSSSISSQAIAAANKEVQKAVGQSSVTGKKRGPYNKFTAAQRFEIGKYSCQYGAAEAARHFSRKLGSKVRESSVKSIKKAYLEELRKRPRNDDGEEPISVLPVKKRGRKVLLGDDLDQKVQIYLRKVREGGGAVSARIVSAAARGILLKYNPSMLAERGGPADLNQFWARSLLRRMKFVKRKATTSKSKHAVTDFTKLKDAFLSDVVEAVTMEDIPAELILNWDQTGIKLVPCSSWTMEKQGEKRVEMAGVNDKRQITAVFCGTLLGDFLPVQLIYKGKTNRCHSRFSFPPEWHITHSPNHWSTEETMLQYVEHIIVPYIDRIREDIGTNQTALVVIDNFKGQVTQSVISLLEAHNIHICLLPANTTDLLQPMDISVNKPAKDFIKRQFNQWYTDQVMKQLEERDDDLQEAEIQPIEMGMPLMKEISAKWLVDMAQYLSDNPQIIVNGFIRSGIPGALDRLQEDTYSGNESSQEDYSSDESNTSDEDAIIVL